MVVGGNPKPRYAVGASAHNEAALGFPVARDEQQTDFEARKQVPPALRALTFKLADAGVGRGTANTVLPDALHISRGGVDPECEFAGISTLVSERARDALQPHVADECVFVESDLLRMPGRWFVLWITKIADPVDTARSDLSVWTWRSDGAEVLRPKRLAFNESLGEVRHLFRLPQWRYMFDQDLCTRQFRDLVEAHRLSGFEWIALPG